MALRRCHRGLSSLADGNLLSIPSNVYTDANTDAHTHAHAHKCVAVFCWHSQVNRQIHTHSQLRCSNVLDAYVLNIHCTACWWWCCCCCGCCCSWHSRFEYDLFVIVVLVSVDFAMPAFNCFVRLLWLFVYFSDFAARQDRQTSFRYHTCRDIWNDVATQFFAFWNEISRFDRNDECSFHTQEECEIK